MLGIFGDITSPFGAGRAFTAAGDYADISKGLPLFISTVVRMITIAGGIWMFFNLLIAGFMYLTANGSQETIGKAWNMIWQSLVGLVIIAAAFAITGVISQLLFGDAFTILKPVIYGPGSK